MTSQNIPKIRHPPHEQVDTENHSTTCMVRGWKVPCQSPISPYTGRVKSGINMELSNPCGLYERCGLPYIRRLKTYDDVSMTSESLHLIGCLIITSYICNTIILLCHILLLTCSRFSGLSLRHMSLMTQYLTRFIQHITGCYGTPVVQLVMLLEVKCCLVSSTA